MTARVPNSAATVVSARASFTNSVLVYLLAEKRCLAFLRQRLAAARVEVGKLIGEVKTLGTRWTRHCIRSCAAACGALVPSHHALPLPSLLSAGFCS